MFIMLSMPVIDIDEIGTVFRVGKNEFRQSYYLFEIQGYLISTTKPLYQIGFANGFLRNALPENELSGMCDA